MLYPSSYEIKLDLSMEKFRGQYAKNKATIFDVNGLRISTELKVSKRKDSNKHDRSFRNDMIIDSAEVYLNPASLLFYKFTTLFQKIYGNYNFAYYKEFFKYYLEKLREASGNPNDASLNLDIMKRSIERIVDSRVG